MFRAKSLKRRRRRKKDAGYHRAYVTGNKPGPRDADRAICGWQPLHVVCSGFAQWRQTIANNIANG